MQAIRIFCQVCALVCFLAAAFDVHPPGGVKPLGAGLAFLTIAALLL